MLLLYPGRNLSRSQKVYNFRFLRACRVVENAFGMLAAQWRVYHRVLEVTPETADWVVMASVALHYFQRLHLTPLECQAGAQAPPALQEL